MELGYDTPQITLADEGILLERHAPLVRRVVRQLGAQAGGLMGRDDMEQIGLMALLDALRRYGEPDEAFAGFATLRVRGAILDEMRRIDWRPRSVRQDAHRVRDAVRALTREMGRVPLRAEVLAALDMDDDEYEALLLADNAEEMASFDALLAAGFDQAGDASPERQIELRSELVHALSALSGREQQVVQLYYEFELNLKEIALVLGLTEARVCQINKQALSRMRQHLAAA